MFNFFTKGQFNDLKRGDIIWTDLSPTKGHEQADRRPVLIISKSQFNKTGMVIGLPITTTNGLFRVEINALEKTSYVNCDQPRVLDIEEREYTYNDETYLVKSELEVVLGVLKAIIF